VVLLVPDGNWNQARRIVRRDPDARDAEPVALPPGAPSRYGLRRAPREGAVSTLEAVARALGVLEGEEAERALTVLLDAFVERTQLAAGRLSAAELRLRGEPVRPDGLLLRGERPDHV
jgi:DTW domain-containing protein YfiP